MRGNVEALVWLLIVAACADSRESARHAASKSCTFEVVKTELVTIGAVQVGSERLWFGSIEGATFTREGSVAVIDATRKAVHGISPTGELLWSTGQLGSGPGEFRGLSWIESFNDTILVFDAVSRRFTYLSTSGGVLGESVAASGRPIGRSREGSILYRIGFGSEGATDGFISDSVRLRLYDHQGELLTTMGNYPGFDRFLNTQFGFSVWQAPFGRRPTYVLRDTLLLLAPAVDNRIALGSLDGALKRVTIPASAREITDAHITSFREAERISTRSTAASEAMLRQVQFPTRTPAYGDAFVDRLGNAWVQHYPLPGDSESTYTILSAAGEIVTEASIPAIWQVLDADAERVVGQTTDESGTPQLVIVPVVCRTG